MNALVWADAASPEEGASQANALFRDAFGYEPRGVWSAPGRVNIIGEHVDYNGGPCLPIALPHRAYVALSPRADRTIRLISPQTRDAVDVLDLDVLGPKGGPGEVTNHWTAYLAGVAWALEKAGHGPIPGFDAALWSCVPLGGGLSSSAALECATAVALDEVCSLGLAGPLESPNDEGRRELVDAARVAENQIAGANTGGLDQTASMRCQEGHALALDCSDMSTRQVPFDLGGVGLELLVIDTRAKHSLADGQYGSRRADCEESARLLGVRQLATRRTWTRQSQPSGTSAWPLARGTSSPRLRARAPSLSCLTRGRWRGAASPWPEPSCMTPTNRCATTTRSAAPSWTLPSRPPALPGPTAPA